MAGDWIKVRCDLQTHPKVVRILSAMRLHEVQDTTDKFRVIGGLHAVWTVFDQHSTDGRLTGYTPEIMDHVIGWDGFSAAMMAVDWLARDDDGALVMPDFIEHNGKSGKRRAEDQKRKRDSRRASEDCPQSVRNPSAENRTREEKRREEKKEDKKPIGASGDAPAYPPEFEELWQARARRSGPDSKKAAFKAYSARLREGVTHERLLTGVKAYAAYIRAEDKENTEFVKQAATFLGPNEHYLQTYRPKVSTLLPKPSFAVGAK